MNVWRLADNRYARDLSGSGSKINGGRWNDVGTAVLYTSERLSLAALEILVHAPDLLRADFAGRVAVQIAIPDDLEVKEIGGFPLALKGAELQSWCLRAGVEWITKSQTPLLRVPSIVVPEEFNIIVSCAHPAMRRVRIRSMRPFTFDKRLFG
jgi:RES domain-containing protein